MNKTAKNTTETKQKHVVRSEKHEEDRTKYPNCTELDQKKRRKEFAEKEGQQGKYRARRSRRAPCR